MDCGPAWTIDQLKHTICQGAHLSTQSPQAAQALLSKTLQKVSAGYAQIIPWSKLKLNISVQLKISPITAIPYKTKAFWIYSMKELGWVLPKIIYTLVHAPAGPPLLFVKLDIKDGF